MKQCFLITLLMILSTGMATATGVENATVINLGDLTGWLQLEWDKHDLPTQLVDIPADLPKGVHGELARTHPNRGMRQQYELTYAGRYLSDSYAPYLLFGAARNAELKEISSIDYGERDYLFGDKELLLRTASELFRGTRHAITALYFIARDKLDSQFAVSQENVNTDSVHEAIGLFEDLLSYPNMTLSDNVFRTGHGLLATAFNPSHTASVFNIGKAYELLEEWNQAITAYQNLVDAFPDERSADEAAARIIIINQLHISQSNQEKEG